MDARALLELQIAWGAGAALAAEPIDRFRQPPPLSSPAPIQAAGPSRVLAGPDTLDGLRAAIAAFDCPLRATVTRVVLPQGPEAASLLIVGEVPDGDADAAGTPYAGAAGATFDAWLTTAGIVRADALVMAAMPWRPPGARPPTAAEEASARPFVQRLISLSCITHVLTLGPVAARMTLDAAVKPGTAVERDGRLTLVMPSVGDCVRRPGQKRIVWATLRHMRRSRDEISA